MAVRVPVRVGEGLSVEVAEGVGVAVWEGDCVGVDVGVGEDVTAPVRDCEMLLVADAVAAALELCVAELLGVPVPV